MQLEQGAAVGGIGAVQGAQDAEVIHTLRHVGKQFADRKPAFAVVFEGPRRFQKRGRRRKLNPRLLSRIGLAVIAIQQGLGIKGVDLRRSAFHQQKNHALGPRRKMGPLGSHRIDCCSRCAGLREQGRGGEPAKSHGGSLQHPAARQSLGDD